MSAPAQCPSCGTKLQPDWEACPNCPMSFLDRPPEKGPLQSDAFRNYGIPLLLFGGLAYAVWSFSQFMWRTAEAGKPMAPSVSNGATIEAAAAAGALSGGKRGAVAASDSRSLQEIVDNLGKEPLPSPSPDLASPPAEAAPAPAAEDEGEGQGTVSVMTTGAPAKSVAEWRMRGTIYDLVTLRPIPGVRMTFTDNKTNSRAHILADAQGRYRTVLPALPGRGYLVTLAKSGYEKTYLDPGTEGVAEMPLERRRELAKELATLIAEPASLQPNSDTPLVTDFHLAPK